MTERARVEVCRRVGQDGHSMAQVAADLGVSCATLMAGVVEYGTPLIDDPADLAGVQALGVDETAFLAANGRRHTQFLAGMVDVSARPCLDGGCLRAAAMDRRPPGALDLSGRRDRWPRRWGTFRRRRRGGWSHG
ncbi:MAG: hypothetical protein ABJA74_10420 [Lapillicoccus sp.]